MPATGACTEAGAGADAVAGAGAGSGAGSGYDVSVPLVSEIESNVLLGADEPVVPLNEEPRCDDR